MGHEESQLRAAPDGGVLVLLRSGIRVVRRRKHEPIPIEGLSEQELASRTDHRNGSKFLPGTTLARIVEMTAAILVENNAAVGCNDGYGKIYEEPIGISKGRRVRGVRVVRSAHGQYAHAYPADEREL